MAYKLRITEKQLQQYLVRNALLHIQTHFSHMGKFAIISI